MFRAEHGSEPLIRYLFGPGRHEEHLDPHIVAGWRHPAELEPPLRPDGRRDFRRLNGLLNQPQAALGPRAFERPVWHCAVRAAPGDRIRIRSRARRRDAAEAEGCMNDMAVLCEDEIATPGGLRQADLAGLNRALRRNINSARGYQRPIDLTRQRPPAQQ